MLPVEADLLLGPDSSLEMDSETDDQSYSPTDVGYIMHMVSCIAYFIHQIYHLLSLDIICVNVICLVSLSYM